MTTFTLTPAEMQMAKNAAYGIKESFGEYQVGAVTFVIEEDFFNKAIKRIVRIKQGYNVARLNKHERLNPTQMRELEQYKLELASLAYNLGAVSFQIGTENLYIITEDKQYDRDDSSASSLFKQEQESKTKEQIEAEGTIALIGLGVLLVGTVVAVCFGESSKK